MAHIHKYFGKNKQESEMRNMEVVTISDMIKKECLSEKLILWKWGSNICELAEETASAETLSIQQEDQCDSREKKES